MSKNKLTILLISVFLVPPGCTAVKPCATHGKCSSVDRTAGKPEAPPGFLVAAPDRGFVGNEKVREAFSALAATPQRGIALTLTRNYPPLLSKRDPPAVRKRSAQ
jgi:hypothetical protein